jgi:hypothetical protein
MLFSPAHCLVFVRFLKDEEGLLLLSIIRYEALAVEEVLHAG